ncbi:diacylglycerol kinase family protein [Patescibacteria group bacterium]|nr:diacylglycerol kinase family protein [Patescibacteria group bacterium]
MDEVSKETEEHINSFKYAFQGLVHALKEGRNFRTQALFGILVMILGWVFSFNRIEWSILLVTISLVLTSELLNTVIELVVDIAAHERILPKAKIAKDVSAGFVLLISIFAAIIGIVLFYPHVREAINIF